MRKRIRAALVGFSLLLLLTACGGQQKKELGYQLDKPAAGEEIAVMETSMGEMKLRFFPEAAPKAVGNFKQLVQKEYYDGITFHRVMDNFMIQGGDPTATGTGGASASGAPFEDEFSESLINLRGAVSMANSGPNTNGSQFFINQAPASSFSGWEYYQQGYDVYKQSPDAFTTQYGSWVDMSKISDTYKKLYTENGGNPTLDGAYSTTKKGHTVFAQVFEGMDVVDKIAAVEVDGSNKPTADVTITKITLEKYQG